MDFCAEAGGSWNGEWGGGFGGLCDAAWRGILALISQPSGFFSALAEGSRRAEEAGRVHPSATVRAASGNGCKFSRTAQLLGSLSSMNSAAAASDRIDGSSADAQFFGDLAARQAWFVEQTANFQDDGGGEHRKRSFLCAVWGRRIFG